MRVGERGTRAKNVPLEKVPEPLMTKEKLPNIPFEQAWTTPASSVPTRVRADLRTRCRAGRRRSLWRKGLRHAGLWAKILYGRGPIKPNFC